MHTTVSAPSAFEAAAFFDDAGAVGDGAGVGAGVVAREVGAVIAFG